MATTVNSTGFKTFTATAAVIPQYARVTVDSDGLISVAAADANAIGICMEYVPASGKGTVKLFSAPGTFIFIASEAITRGNQIYAAADGEIAASGTGAALPFIALQAAGADQDLIEASRFVVGA